MVTRTPSVLRIVTLLTSLLAVAPLGAQAPGVGSTTAANPAVASQRGGEAATLEANRRPGLDLEEEAGTGLDAPAPATSTPGAESVKIRLEKVVFTGVTLVDYDELAELAHPFEQQEVTFAELELLARIVEKHYVSRGYLAVSVVIPAQKVEGGVIEMAVFEGRYGKVEVVGNRHYSTEFLEKYFGFARENQPVLQGPLLRTLLVLREFPGLTVQSVLRAGEAPGTTDLVLQVREARPLRYGYEYNNHGIRLVGQNRASVFVSHFGTFTSGDELSLRVTELFPSDSKPIYQGGYSIPVGDKGATVGVQYLRSKTKVGGAFVPLDLRGDVEVGALSYNRPLVRTLRKSTGFSASLAAKTVQSFVFGDVLTSRDDLRVLSAAYTDSRTSADRRSILQASVSQGLGEALGGRPNGDPLASRLGAGNEFTKLNLDGILLGRVNQDSSFFVRGSAQVTDEALTVAELFSLGGADSVRGFVQSEFLGDRGYFASVEFRKLFYDAKSLDIEWKAFLDHGGAEVVSPQPGETGSRALTGAGVGLRFAFANWGTLRLDVGMPVSPDVNIDGEDAMLYAQHIAQF